MLDGVARAKRDAFERIVGNNDMDAGFFKAAGLNWDEASGKFVA